MTDTQPSLPAASTGQISSDHDLAGDDRLLGVPIRSFLHVRALRGLGLVLVAVATLLWPAPTDAVIAFLAGAALAAYAATTAFELIRHRRRRRFPRVLGVGVSAGFAAALMLRPEESLLSVTEAAGAFMFVLAAVTVFELATRRVAPPWGITKVGGLLVAGGLLLRFPEVLVQAATSVVAGALAAAGLIQVFVPRDGEDAPTRDSPASAITDWVRRRPDEIEDRSTLHEKVFFEGPTSPVRYVRFAALMGFASVIATIGVAVESTAVVIGAMLVAPLMVPLMGTALSLTMGWPRRTIRCAGIAVSGMVIAVSTGAIIGTMAPRTIDVDRNTEILSRISPTMLDLAIAIAAGAAGAYALSRRDVSDSLPGVAVAIALVPPLAVVGLCWQQGEWAAGNGALLLFITNATAILIAGGTTFLLVGAAPLDRVSDGQERLKSAAVGLLAATGIVIALLALNGAQATQAELARASVDRVVEQWADEHEGYRVIDVRSVTGNDIEIDLAGPGEPPDLDRLIADLEAEAGSGVEITLTWVKQDQLVISGPD